MVAIRSSGGLIHFYVNQNLLGEEGLGTRFSFSFEADTTALPAFLGQFCQTHEAATGESFRNPDDMELALLPVLDWSEQITFRR
ncbi:hypothetical protein [Geodermatophilus sp. SYSU D01176]